MTPPVSDLPIVDAHHHLWDLGRFPYAWLQPDAPPRRFGDHSAIKKNYLAADYLSDFAGFNLVGSVHVQANAGAADPVEETAWLQQVANQSGIPTAIVAEADLTLGDAKALIKRHAAYENFRGVRSMAAWDSQGHWRFAKAPGLLADASYRRGVAALADCGGSLDLVVAPEQIVEVADLARAFPSLSIAINHLGQVEPDVSGSAQAWRDGLASLASCPNVSMKLSGLWTIDLKWSPSRLRPFFQTALTVLGPDRIIYGSNLPVEKVNTPLRRQLDVLMELLDDETEDVVDRIMRRNAASFYRLPDPSPS